MVITYPLRPRILDPTDSGPDRVAGRKLHAMALPIVKPDRLDARISLQRPGQADGRVLPTGEKHEC